MDATRKAALDRAERAGYLPALRSLAQGICVPFWWHGGGVDGRYQILHNGTVCFVDTGDRKIAITADHVYRQYLTDKDNDATVVCQFGGATIEPERHLVHRDHEQDLATFELSDVYIGATGGSTHCPLTWPTEALKLGDAVLLGGYPGVLRVEGAVTADLPFQWFAGAVTSVSSWNISLHLDLPNLHWPLHETKQLNAKLGGMSGGPVFKFISSPIERLVLAGFIYEYHETYELILARPAACIGRNGTVSSSEHAVSQETPSK
jgi:Trypsin-like peptidase domain